MVLFYSKYKSLLFYLCSLPVYPFSTKNFSLRLMTDTFLTIVSVLKQVYHFKSLKFYIHLTIKPHLLFSSNIITQFFQTYTEIYIYIFFNSSFNNIIIILTIILIVLHDVYVGSNIMNPDKSSKIFSPSLYLVLHSVY